MGYLDYFRMFTISTRDLIYQKVLKASQPSVGGKSHRDLTIWDRISPPRYEYKHIGSIFGIAGLALKTINHLMFCLKKVCAHRFLVILGKPLERRILPISSGFFESLFIVILEYSSASPNLASSRPQAILPPRWQEIKPSSNASWLFLIFLQGLFVTIHFHYWISILYIVYRYQMTDYIVYIYSICVFYVIFFRYSFPSAQAQKNRKALAKSWPWRRSVPWHRTKTCRILPCRWMYLGGRADGVWGDMMSTPVNGGVVVESWQVMIPFQEIGCF